MPGRFRFNRVRQAVREAAAPAPPQPPNWYQEAPVNPGVPPPPRQPRGWQQFDPAAGQGQQQEAQNQAPAPPQPEEMFPGRMAAQVGAAGVGPDIHRRLAALQVELEHQHQAMLQGMKKQKTAKPTSQVRALPAGRMRSVRFGDILKAYRRTIGLHRDHYQMIDFRVPKEGEHYMNTSFQILQADDNVMMPLIIIELVKGKKEVGILDDDYAIDYDRVEVRRR